jgi:TetR/AcrR family transcriptional regulator
MYRTLPLAAKPISTMPGTAPLPPAADASGGGETIGRILAAAAALFAENGYDGTSMHAIAVRAGVSKANLFHHFGSKKELYLAVVRTACRDAERLETLGGDHSGPFPARLSAYATEMLADMLANKQVHRLITRELLAHGEQAGKELAEKVFGGNFARLVEILRTGQARGELRADTDPAMVATLLVGANVFFFLSQDVLRHLPDVNFANDPARYARMVVDLLLNDITTARGERAKKD